MLQQTKTKLLEKFPYFDMSLKIDERVQMLLNRLTLKEKFMLLSGKNFSFWTTKSIRRLKMKSLGMTDGPHGCGLHSSFRLATKFPCSKCLSASWNKELAEEYGKTIASEVRSVKRHILLAPGINIDRTPLNGRTFEYYSEDPYLTKEIAVPFINGVQSQRIGTCLKHYAVNNQETNRMTISAEVDKHTLNEIYLRAFQDVVQEAEPWSVMGSYNRINGIYACEHQELLRDILMDQWNFSGFVVTDWWASKPLKNPARCIKAGLSLEMPKPYAYKIKRLIKSFKEGKFSVEELDFVVKRLLRVMFQVGLFDHPKTIPKGYRNTKTHQMIAKRIAEEGLVLLKNNENILPLDIEKIKHLAVVGPLAYKRMGKFLYGGSAAVVPPFEITPIIGLKKKLKGKVKFVKESSKADFCILFVGLTHERGQDCENFDRSSLDLPKSQIELIDAVVKQNPKTIVVLINGSPLNMTDWLEKVPAVLEAWHPGMLGGEAIANVLFGDINPSGKLPITFPKRLEESPAHKSSRTFPGDSKVYYDEGIFVGYRHFDKKNIEPLFPFGFGLSYSTFKYENLIVRPSVLNQGQPLEVLVDITNTSKRDGTEVVQLYIRDDASTLARPEKELRGFAKVQLKPNETKTITFEITEKDISFYNPVKKDWCTEKGTFTILIGSSSRHIYLETKITFDSN